ncbi:outer membrane beta-barrel protein [Ferruginibacter sp. SUN002]|uniref:outer membrane beta-barrel protein n=1 Tax=Ferruginibacter sp. SUN002 TaxID=2937789 RepID=UPI003D35CD1A
MPKLTVTLAALLFYININGQTMTGKIADENKINIKNAVVALLTPKDSILYKFTRTDGQGNFSIKNIKPGNYILLSTHPYYADLLDNIQIGNADTNLSTVKLISKTKILQEVIVSSGSPIRIKGDTTVYTADSFKVSANANVEELLRKLPGIQVDKAGKITAMGEQVNKVLVDGEEFFGDDPGMTVKNLRADAVKEVQVYDKKSDQAEFTGIDDGNSQKTINLKLKEDRKTGYFGKVDAAGGLKKNIDDRYNTNLMYSTFKGKRKLSAFLLRGNTGQDGLGWQDMEKYGGENDNFDLSVDDEGDINFNVNTNIDEEPYINTQNGYIVNTNAGLQYSNKWNDKQTLNLSPKYNNQQYSNNKYNFLKTIIGDSVLNENASTVTNVTRSNFKLNASYNVMIDSANTIKFTAKSSFYSTDSKEFRGSTTTGDKGNIKNISSKKVTISNDKYSIYGSILFKHKFKKARRTLSLNTDWNTLSTDNDSYLDASNDVYTDGNISSSLLQNQLSVSDKSSQNFSARLVYTEPLSKNYSIELSHKISYNYGNIDQITNAYSNISNKFDTYIDSLSNHFKQKITTNTPTAKISYNYKKLKYSFGSGFGFTNFSFKDITLDKDYKRNYINLFPAANLSYTFKSNANLRFYYNGNTTQPTIYELQPIQNNTDYFNQYIGNPNLRPSFSNSFSLSYGKYNFIKDKWMHQSIRINTTSNAITTSKIINVDSAKTIIQPVNTNGNYSINVWTGYQFKFKKIETRLFLSPRYNYTKTTDFLNNVKNTSNTVNTGIELRLSKSKDKKYDINIGNDFYFNKNKSALTSIVNTFNTNTFSIDGTVYYKKTWSLTSDYSYNYRQKIPGLIGKSSNQSWNATLKKTFKNDEFTAYLIARDILNDNIGVDMRYYSNTYSEERNDRLKRYFLLGFTWNFRNKTAGTK